MKIGVTIASAGREDLLAAAIRSAEPVICRDFVGLSVVADGGWEPSRVLREQIWTFPGDLFLKSESGLAEAWNFGLASLFDKGADAVLVLNDDAELPLNWDIYLGATLETYPDRMCVCLPDRLTASRLVPEMTPGPKWGSEPWVVQNYPKGFEPFAQTFKEISDDKSWAPCSMNGAAFVLRKQTVEEVGYFDEGFDLCFEDLDYYLRLLKQYGPDRIGTYMRVFIHHWRCATISSLPDRQARVDASRAHFWKKWAGQEKLVEWFQTVNDAPLGTPRPEMPL